MKVAIVQARLGSTRLPRKIMLNLAGKKVIEHVIERCKQIKNIDCLIVATTNLPEDNEILDICRKLGVKTFTGSTTNVLSRFYYCAKTFNAKWIVRVSSDCPLFDYEIASFILNKAIELDPDYISIRSSLSGLPHGFNTEIVKFEALEKCYKDSIIERHREHVTSYIKDNEEEFKIFIPPRYIFKEKQRNYRLTLDTKDDFIVLKYIYSALFKGKPIKPIDILMYLDRHPSIAQLNSKVEQDKRYF